MGKLLEQAVAELSKLPEDEQEAVGAWILAELESERRWDDLFARSPTLLSKLADNAVREDEAGLTQRLEQVIVRKVRSYSFEDIHRAIFPRPPKRRTLAELKEGIRQHARWRADKLK